MKRIIFFVLLLFSVRANAQSQLFEINAGMGIDMSATPSLNDYINASFATSEDQRSSVNTNVEFYGEVGRQISEHFQMGVEYALAVSSYNTVNFKAGKYDISYTIHMPSLMAYYVINGNGYKFKFGGGAGYRLASVDETLSYYSSAVNYTSSGIGLLLKADGSTSLGGNLYANIQGLIRMDFIGTPKSGNTRLAYNNIANEDVNMNSISAGIRLGLTYMF
ncbi:MAG: hypothetical protein HF309_16850 [Ignavibacteria bacterium]|jgi:hypothetical protein|nr:hypothetical protein [Ignavibacteria bacterium]MCU7500943.1 hypothetical protein [Ignavibacteria bacterium]MCU7519650.1 hypothetical protein [Ignavibacteria bacterium]MCU7525498.1 hypothetical protein [Ignavibacteria bacterium]